MSDKTEILGFGITLDPGLVHAIAMTADGEIICSQVSSSEYWARHDLGMDGLSKRHHEWYIERFEMNWSYRFVTSDEGCIEYGDLLDAFLYNVTENMFVHKVMCPGTDREPIWSITSYKDGTSLGHFDTEFEADTFLDDADFGREDIDLEEQWEEDVWAEVDGEREALQARVKELESAIKEVHSAFCLDSGIRLGGMTGRAIMEHLDPLYVDIREKEESNNE